MNRLLSAVVVITVVGCASDAEREATLKQYEDPAPQAVSGCDKAAANNVMALMTDPNMARVATTKSGIVIVHFGSDYSGWSPSQAEGIVTSFANADACVTGEARHIEFQAPSGRVVARADKLRGIHMTR